MVSQPSPTAPPSGEVFRQESMGTLHTQTSAAPIHQLLKDKALRQNNSTGMSKGCRELLYQLSCEILNQSTLFIPELLFVLGDLDF